MADSEQPAAAAAAAPVYTTVGRILREARVGKDLTVDQIATELRIEARQLAALEDDRFEQIGPAVFIKGYIRQYAQRLGLDQPALMELYGRQTNIREVQVQPSRQIKLRDERQITVWVVALLVLLLIAVGLAVWWLNGGGGVEFGSTPRAAQSAPASVESAAAVAAEPPAEAAPVSTEVASVDAANTATSAPVEVERAPAPAPLPAAASTGAPAAVTAAVSRGVPPLSLDLTFDSESWAEITDARGQRLFFEVGTKGRHAVLRGEPPIAVTFGNGDGVRLIVDGEPFAIPTQGRQGKLVRFTIGSDEE